MPLYRVETDQGKCLAYIEASAPFVAYAEFREQLNSLASSEGDHLIIWEKSPRDVDANMEGFFFQEEGDPYCPVYVVRNQKLEQVETHPDDFYIIEDFIKGQGTSQYLGFVITRCPGRAPVIVRLKEGETYHCREIRSAERYDWEITGLESLPDTTFDEVEIPESFGADFRDWMKRTHPEMIAGLKARRCALFGKPYGDVSLYYETLLEGEDAGTLG